MLMEILGHITDDAEAQSIVATLLDGLPSGSYLVIADGTKCHPHGARRGSAILRQGRVRGPARRDGAPAGRTRRTRA